MKRKTFLLPSVLRVFFLLKTLFFLSFSLQNIFLLILEILFVSFTDENLFFFHSLTKKRSDFSLNLTRGFLSWPIEFFISF